MSEPENTADQVLARDSRGRFLRGAGSPNPGGRPQVVGHVRELAREHTPAAIGALVSIVRNTRAPAAARVSAASALLDRAYGRPETSVAVSASSWSRPVSQETVTPDEAVAAYIRLMNGGDPEEALAVLEGPRAPVETTARVYELSLPAVEPSNVSVEAAAATDCTTTDSTPPALETSPAPLPTPELPAPAAPALPPRLTREQLVAQQRAENEQRIELENARLREAHRERERLLQLEQEREALE